MTYLYSADTLRAAQASSKYVMIYKTEKISKFKKYFSKIPLDNENIYFHDIIKPFYYILTSVGLLPNSIKYDSSSDRFIIIQNSIYLNSLCALSCLLLIYLFYFLHIQDLYTSDVNSLTNVLITQLNYLIELTALLLYCTVAYICAFKYRNKYVHIFNTFNSIWADVRKLDGDEILAKLRYRIQVVAVGSIVLAVLLQLSVNFSRDDDIWKIALVAFSFILPQTIQFISLAFLYVLAMMMVAILSSIKQRLAQLSQQVRSTGDLFTKVNVITPTVLSLRKLETAYSRAFEMKREINAVFEASLLMTALQSFHCIVSESYTVYHGVVASTHSAHNLVNNLVWIVYQFIKIFTMAHAGNKLLMKSTEVGQMLHTIPTEKQELRILVEIQHFASSMQYQEFVINVYGYFRLDSSLMATMVATVTMYLVILVQFDKSSVNMPLMK